MTCAVEDQCCRSVDCLIIVLDVSMLQAFFESKVNASVCDPVSVCGYFFIFSSIDEANDKKPYDNHYKHYPE